MKAVEVQSLTERELEVLNLMKEGVSSLEQISKKLNISIDTTKTHRVHIYNKLGVSNPRRKNKGGYHSAIKAISKGIQLGIVEPPKLQVAVENHPELGKMKT